MDLLHRRRRSLGGDPAIVSVRASPRSMVPATTGALVADSFGLGRHRERRRSQWDERSGTFVRVDDVLAGRRVRQLELVLTTCGLTVIAVRPTGRPGDTVIDVATESLGTAVACPARVMGVGVLHLDLTIDDAELGLVVARPHRDDVGPFVRRWHQLAAATHR